MKLNNSNTQYSHPKSLPEYEIKSILRQIFEDAKSKDEFEFCSTLLRVRGMEDAGWDPLYESQKFINQVINLIDSSTIPNDLKLRMSLMLYCHITEMHDLYHIIGNLLRIIQGNRYSIKPFSKSLHSSNKNANYPHTKSERIHEWAIKINQPLIGEMFRNMLVKEVRNAFLHSDYILYNDEFRIRQGEGVKIGNFISPSVKLAWLVPRLELGSNVGLTVIELTFEYIKSYTADKIVKGRLLGENLPPIDIKLIADKKYGLKGFQTK